MGILWAKVRAEGKRRVLGSRAANPAGAKSLRPDLRMANSEDGRTPYWQGPEQTRHRTARTVFRALRGSPDFCVSRSKARPQVIWSREICCPAPQDTPLPFSPALQKAFIVWKVRKRCNVLTHSLANSTVSWDMNVRTVEWITYVCRCDSFITEK